MRFFVKQSIKGGRCTDFIQHYKSILSDNVFSFISKDLYIIGNICEILDKYFEFSNEYENLYAEELDSNYDDYRDFNQKKRTENIANKLDMLAVHKQLTKLNSNNTQMDFGATSLIPSAMCDKRQCILK